LGDFFTNSSAHPDRSPVDLSRHRRREEKLGFVFARTGKMQIYANACTAAHGANKWNLVMRKHNKVDLGEIFLFFNSAKS
jgi:hypothetical protein